MYFTSYEFIGFIIITCFLYYVLPKKFQWPVLLVASFVFYALSGPTALLFIVFSGISVYLSALFLEKSVREQKNRLKSDEALTKEEKGAIKKKAELERKICLFVCIAVNVAVLVFVKTSGLFAVLGISYYTLRAIGYLVDVKRGAVSVQKNIFKFLLYISFFPVVIQGPLTDYGELTKTLYGEHVFSGDELVLGIARVLWGFFKKLVIADRAFVAVREIAGNGERYNGAWVLVGMVLYTLELYADFTGGIDITLGVSEMFGISVGENFDRPFFSTSLKEYWRRWHISMCAWFRTYLFYPVSVSAPMRALLKFTRKHFGEKAGKRIPVYLSSAVVWFITGLWHGFSANYITWAMLHFAILMISEELEPLFDGFHKKCPWSNSVIYRIFQSIRTVFIVSLLMQFDIFTSVPVFFSRIGSVFTAGKWKEVFNGGLMQVGLTGADYTLLLFGAVLMFVVSLIKGEGEFRDILAKRKKCTCYITVTVLFLLVLLFGKYGVGYDAGQFIYTRF